MIGHDWVPEGLFGVLLGSSYCRRCGAVARRDNLNTVCQETHSDTVSVHWDGPGLSPAPEGSDS